MKLTPRRAMLRKLVVAMMSDIVVVVLEMF
jgi:hypothetical protein